MRKTLMAIGFVALTSASLVSASLVWAAAEFDMDLMPAIEDAAKDLVSNISLANAPAVNANVKELDELLAQVEDHYAKKGDAPDAVGIAQSSRALLIEIKKLVAAKDFDAANAKSAEFGRNCKSCHKVYKKG